MKKAIFIVFDQAHIDDIHYVLDRYNCRGFTSWEEVKGRGSRDGIPHYGSHAWPSINGAIITIVDEQLVKSLFNALTELNNNKPKLGLRAFVWSIEDMI